MKVMLINAMSMAGVVTALVLLILSVALFCNEHGFHPLHRNTQRFREFKWFEKLFFVVFVGVMTLFASIKDNPTNSPPSNLPPVGLVGNSSSSLLRGFNNDVSIDCNRVSAIDVSTNGVSLTLHRPETNALDNVEVTVAGATNLVTATWEAYTNIVFAAGVTNVGVFISCEMMAAHSVSNINFFAFIQSGDSDGDGIDDWFERFNLSTDPFDPDSDHDGMDDGWELSHGLDPGSSRDAWLDADDDGVANIEEYTHGTDPENPDTDGDGIADRDEIGWVTFTSSRTVETKVSRGEAAFDWQLVNIGGIPFPPTPFYATGPHRIYTILADPVAPWSSDPNSSQCAWTNALEWACTHAQGSVTFNESASCITRSIFSSGKFVYGTSDGEVSYCGLTWRGDETLDLTACLDRFKGEYGNGPRVICTDCAMFVTAFSNLLGCSLYGSQMRGCFYTNPIVAIGHQGWEWPLPSVENYIIYHEVAWSGNCEDGDLVYDACLQYDGDDDPSQAPHVAEQPCGVVFSDGSADAPLVYQG